MVSKKKIAVLTSGGVDSSVVLKILKDKGFNVTAFYLKVWFEDEFGDFYDCPWEEDLNYLYKICEQEKIKLKIVSLQKEYWDRVVSYLLKEVKVGRTPNPDIMCNLEIKFGEFYRKFGHEFDQIATGHYAKIIKKNGQFLLGLSEDSFKDQSYFLSRLSSKQLSKIIFPIGKYKKSFVRKLAHKYNLPNKNRKDSQGICFLGKIKFDDFLRSHLGEKKGNIIDFRSGKKLGEHRGFWFFTIGQRKNICLSGGPWFVVQKNSTTNEIFVSTVSDDGAVDNFYSDNLRFFVDDFGEEVFVKIRHGEEMLKCHVEFFDDGRCRCFLEKKEKGIASGQFVVFYNDKICLGSGVIC